MELYNILVDSEQSSIIQLNNHILNVLKLEGIQEVQLKYGQTSILVSISVLDHLEDTEIQLSTNIIQELGIQTSSQYELYWNGNELLIGPFIGLLLPGIPGKNGVLKWRKSRLTRYIKLYKEIGGTIVAFALSGINKESQTIKGYIYNPKTDCWESGTVPFPSAIFNRIILKKEWRDYFTSIISTNFFNSYWFNKWTMHKWLAPYQHINKHLPDTILYTNPKDIFKHIEKHQKIYIKPNSGSSGKGIYVLTKTNDGFILKYRINRKNIINKYQTFEEVENILKRKLTKNRYIIQESIDLTFDGKSIYDFRMVIVKDQSGEWKDKGFLGRRGPENSIVSNRSNGGNLEIGETILQQVFQLDHEHVKVIRKKIAEIGISAAEKLDSHHHYGNLGIDFGIDKNMHFWILEINNRDPAHYNASRINRMDLVYDAALANMLYAKKLAGFHQR